MVPKDTLHRRLVLRALETEDIPGTIAELLNPDQKDLREENGENTIEDLIKQNEEMNEDLVLLLKDHEEAIARLDKLAESGTLRDAGVLDEFADRNPDYVEAYGRHIVKYSDLLYSTAQLNPPPAEKREFPQQKDAAGRTRTRD